MIALLDVNVLVALFDPTHIHHEAAHRWFGPNRKSGWATCPATENALVRVLTNPGYPGRRTTVADAVSRLRAFCKGPGHSFWPDGVSLRSTTLIRPKHVQGHRQITDVYLLALAVTQGGRLATFDRNISLEAVADALPRHLALIPS